MKKLIIAAMATSLAVSSVAATNQKPTLKPANLNSATFNVALIATSNAFGGGILGEAKFENSTAGIMLGAGTGGRLALGLRLGLGFNGAYASGPYASLMGNYVSGFDMNAKDARDDWGGQVLLGYQYFHQSGINAAAGVGIGYQGFTQNYWDKDLADEGLAYNPDPDHKYVDGRADFGFEFRVGYAFRY